MIPVLMFSKLLVYVARTFLAGILPLAIPLLSFNAAALSLLGTALQSISMMVNNLVANDAVGHLLINDEAIGSRKTLVLVIRLSNVTI